MMVYIMACIAALVLKLMERDGGNGAKLKDKLIPSARENNQCCVAVVMIVVYIAVAVAVWHQIAVPAAVGVAVVWL